MVGRLHQILRETSQQLRLRRQIEPVDQFAQHMRRRHDDEFVELVRRGILVDPPGDRLRETLFRQFMRIGARDVGVPSGRATFKRPSRPVGDEVVVAACARWRNRRASNVCSALSGAGRTKRA